MGEGESGIGRALTDWFEENGRNFPWRESNDPFEILLAEIMLQKTSASQVLPVWEELTTLCPDPEDLAEMEQDEIADIIYPLGLQNRRSKRLKELAEILVEEHGGSVPRDEEGLKELPGVGDYVCNAVLCMAYGRDRVMFDSNFGRVFGRYLEGEEDYQYPNPGLEEQVSAFMPEGQCRKFNLAVLDLGASICRPQNPPCGSCPISSGCARA